MLSCVGREHYRLSVTDGCRWRGGDGTSILFRVPEALVNIAHMLKYTILKRAFWRVSGLSYEVYRSGGFKLGIDLSAL